MRSIQQLKLNCKGNFECNGIYWCFWGFFGYQCVQRVQYSSWACSMCSIQHFTLNCKGIFGLLRYLFYFKDTSHKGIKTIINREREINALTSKVAFAVEFQMLYWTHWTNSTAVLNTLNTLITKKPSKTPINSVASKVTFAVEFQMLYWTHWTNSTTVLNTLNTHW